MENDIYILLGKWLTGAISIIATVALATWVMVKVKRVFAPVPINGTLARETLVEKKLDKLISIMQDQVRQQKANGEHLRANGQIIRDFVLVNADRLKDIEMIKNNGQKLYDMHNEKSTDGILRWYVPESLKENIRKILTLVQRTRASD